MMIEKGAAARAVFPALTTAATDSYVERIRGESVQHHENIADVEAIAAEAPSRDWQKPIATFVPVSSTANGSGPWPDAGVDYS